MVSSLLAGLIQAAIRCANSRESAQICFLIKFGERTISETDDHVGKSL